MLKKEYKLRAGAYNETTLKEGDFPLFRLLVETLADPRSAIFVLRNPTS